MNGSDKFVMKFENVYFINGTVNMASHYSKGYHYIYS